MKVKVYNPSGEPVSDLDLNPKIFELENINPNLIHEVVVGIRSSQRGSIAHSKTRGEVRGGGKKPWQQKGTGRARVGSIRSPLWRGGGITFGPTSKRNWDLKINKKTKILALFSVLTDKARSGQIVVVDNLNLTQPKTRELAAKLKDLRARFPALGRKQTLVITPGQNDLVRAAKNLPSIHLQTPANLNILELIAAPGLVIMKDALAGIEKTYLRNNA